MTVRFSSSTGIPQLPDNDPNGEPRGIAIRFHLGEHKHTDIIGHSTPHFPTRTGEEFLELLRAIAASPAGTPSPTQAEKFLGSHPAALTFVQAPKPIGLSFATETYFGLNAHKFIDSNGRGTFFRYRVLPQAGESHLDKATAKSQDANFLQNEIRERLKRESVKFRLVAQIGEEGDQTDDVTIQWPEDRKIVELGSITLDAPEENDAMLQRQIIFDPIARVAGIEPSKDPLLEYRAAVYLISGKERR